MCQTGRVIYSPAGNEWSIELWRRRYLDILILWLKCVVLKKDGINNNNVNNCNILFSVKPFITYQDISELSIKIFLDIS